MMGDGWNYAIQGTNLTYFKGKFQVFSTPDFIAGIVPAQTLEKFRWDCKKTTSHCWSSKRVKKKINTLLTYLLIKNRSTQISQVTYFSLYLPESYLESKVLHQSAYNRQTDIFCQTGLMNFQICFLYFLYCQSQEWIKESVDPLLSNPILFEDIEMTWK